MDKLSQSFLDSCRRDGGRILRGENMTRIETFVDAAFAFAFTMLVISIDEIPDNFQELLQMSRDIPAFLLSATIIGSIWLAHSSWSRTFGLQDRLTIYLSLALVMLVLIFVYPIKLIVQITVKFLSSGYLGTDLDMGRTDAAYLFIYFGLGLIALSLIIISLYQNSIRHKEQLSLSAYEIFYCNRTSISWSIVATTAAISCIVAVFLRQGEISIAGFVYTTLFFTISLFERFYARYEL